MATQTPALQNRSAYHRNWGNYNDGGQTTPANGTLPNQASAPLNFPEFAKLEAGDMAYVTAVDPGLYVCQNPGTVGNGDATWVPVGATSITRAAPQIVVGSSAAPYNNTSADADVLEPGDGTGIESALANAAALVSGGYEGVDVRLRPMNVVIDPSSVSLPMAIGTNVRLYGAGQNVTQIIGGDGQGNTSQTVFSVGIRAELHRMQILSPAATTDPAPGNGVVRVFGGNSQVSDLLVQVQSGGPVSRSDAAAIQVSPGAFAADNVVIRDCLLVLDNALVNDGVRSTGVLVGSGSSTLNSRNPVVRDCRILGGNQGVIFLNWQDGIADGIEFYPSSAVCIGVGWVFNDQSPSSEEIRAASISNVFVQMIAEGGAGGEGVGVLIETNAPVQARMARISQVTVDFPSPNLNNTTDRIGVLLQTLDGSDLMLDCTIDQVIVRGDTAGQVAPFDAGIRLSFEGDFHARIGINNCQMTGGDIQYELVGGGATENVRIVGCGGNDGGVGLNIASGNFEDTIAVANHFNGNGASIQDFGTNTLLANNVV